MLTVRYPNGLVVQYDTASYLLYGETEWGLYTTEKDGEWVCSIQPSAGVIVENVSAHRVSKPLAGSNIQELVTIKEELRSICQLITDSKRKAKR